MGREAAHEVGYMQVEGLEARKAGCCQVKDISDVGDGERDVFTDEKHGRQERDGVSEDASHRPQRDEAQGVDQRKLLADQMRGRTDYKRWDGRKGKHLQHAERSS